MCKSSSVNHDHKVEDKEGPRSHAYHMTLSKNLPRPLSLTGHPITPPTYSSLWPVPTTTSKAGLHSACYTPSPAHNPLVRHVRIYKVYHTHTHTRTCTYEVSHTNGLLLVTRMEVIPLCAAECPPLPSTKEGALTRESLGRLMYSTHCTLSVVKRPAPPALSCTIF